jgi:hypothetical protein
MRFSRCGLLMLAQPIFFMGQSRLVSTRSFDDSQGDFVLCAPRPFNPPRHTNSLLQPLSGSPVSRFPVSTRVQLTLSNVAVKGQDQGFNHVK